MYRRRLPIREGGFDALASRRRKGMLPTRLNIFARGHGISSATPKNWRLIQDLAKALLERRTLTGEEVNDVIQSKFKGFANEGVARPEEAG